jgi:serine/threonine protein kinase
VRGVGVKIADALAHAHALGVLHRDVKPANILHSRFGEPALADFGLAVLAESRDSSLSLEVLTPAYAPPEAFRHGTPPSAAADVYALSASLYAMLRGGPPRWREDRMPSLFALVELFNEPIPDIPGVGQPLMDLLKVAMDNEPGRRPTAGRFRDDLNALAVDALGVATTSVFAPGPRDERTVAWGAETVVWTPEAEPQQQRPH